jgi:hypothetical protein
MTAALTLVGWDDILCRPIYRRLPDPAPTKKSRGKKKSTVQFGTSSTSNAVLFSRLPTPDEFKRRSGDIFSDDEINDDRVVEVPKPKRRRQSVKRSSPVSDGHPQGEQNISSSQTFSCDDIRDIASRFVPLNGKHQLEIDTSNSIYETGLANTFDEQKQDECVFSSVEMTDSVRMGDPSNASCSSPSTVVSTKLSESINSPYELEQCEPVDFGSTNFDETESITEPTENDKQQSVYDKSDKLFHSQGFKVDKCMGCPPNCKTNQESAGTGISGDGVSKVLMSPIMKSTPSTSAGFNDSNDKKDMEFNGYCKQFELQSPMSFGYNREDFDPSDADTVDISLFDKLDSNENLWISDQRSYGQSNKPNWATKSSDGHKLNCTETADKQLIGWDDIKCRPIYHVSKPKPIPKEMGSADEMNASSDAEKNDPSTINIQLQKRRAYSSNFRKSSLFTAARHNMDLDSPVARRVTFERESETQDNEAEESSSSSDIGSDLDLLSELEPDSSIQEGKGEGCDEEFENRTQPTSKTTIKSARAFFRYLDSNHHLAIMDHNDESYGSKAKTDVIRTTRRIVYSGQLQDEYDDYRKTVDASGIDPISINEFARHWNLYLTDRGVIRDGLLDED